jgi:hypothetical protein
VKHHLRSTGIKSTDPQFEFQMVLDPQGQLVCLTVCKRGAVEVVRRLVA